MKICHISQGASVHTQRWAKAFSARHEVHLITDNWDESTLKLSGVTVHLLPPSRLLKAFRLNVFWKMFRLKALLKQIKPDVVHTQPILPYGYVGCQAGFRPHVSTVWGSEVLILPQQSPALMRRLKHVINNVDLITCDAEHVIDALVKLGADRKKVKQINFGIDVKKFTPSARNNKIREKFGFGNEPVIISTRSFRPVYDIETLIKAVPAVLKSVPQAKFLIVGRGPLEGELKNLAQSLGVTASIRFISFVSDEDFPGIIASSDIYVSTSLSDAGIASSTAEAMACGLPAIITDFGDNVRWVNDGVNGFIIPLKSPGVLAEKIIYLCKNEADRKKFGRLNPGIINERNSTEKEMYKMELLYKELIKQSGKIPS